MIIAPPWLLLIKPYHLSGSESHHPRCYEQTKLCNLPITTQASMHPEPQQNALGMLMAISTVPFLTALVKNVPTGLFHGAKLTGDTFSLT